MRKLYPADRGPLTDIPNTGCSPTLLRISEWQRVTPVWEAITAQAGPGTQPCASGRGWGVLASLRDAVEAGGGLHATGGAGTVTAGLLPYTHAPALVWRGPAPQIEGDEEAKKALEWVREMYAFSVACALEKVPLERHVRGALAGRHGWADTGRATCAARRPAPHTRPPGSL